MMSYQPSSQYHAWKTAGERERAAKKTAQQVDQRVKLAETRCIVDVKRRALRLTIECLLEPCVALRKESTIRTTASKLPTYTRFF